MHARGVRLPIYGLQPPDVGEDQLLAALRAVPGVTRAIVEPGKSMLDLAYDPGRCGPAQVLAALDGVHCRHGATRADNPCGAVVPALVQSGPPP